MRPSYRFGSDVRPRTRRYAAAMAVPTTQEVRDVLRAVIDPELGDNIVDLGMVGDIAISDGKVSVGVALTIAGCPLRAQIERDVT